MMLAGPTLRVVPITIHVPLAEVPGAAVDRADRRQGARDGARAARAISASSSRASPLPGFNPHAGESGAIGREEIDFIVPAIEQLRAEGIDAIGPFAADTMFHAARARRPMTRRCAAITIRR